MWRLDLYEPNDPVAEITREDVYAQFEPVPAALIDKTDDRPRPIQPTSHLTAKPRIKRRFDIVVDNDSADLLPERFGRDLKAVLSIVLELLQTHSDRDAP